LTPGNEITWENLKFVISSISPPQLPILNTKFITNGHKTALITASESRYPISGTIGDFQCHSRLDADYLASCILANDICTCVSHETQASCVCHEKNIEQIFENQENGLLLLRQVVYIEAQGNIIYAQITQYISLEMQIYLEGYSLTTKIEKNKCQTNFINITGCYHCLTGAKLEIECQTDFTETLAYATCQTMSFSYKCTYNKTRIFSLLDFHSANVDENCTVTCSAGSTNLHIFGTLSFIKRETINKFNNIISYNSNSENALLDVQFSLFSFLSNWKTTFPTIIIVDTHIYFITIYLQNIS